MEYAPRKLMVISKGHRYRRITARTKNRQCLIAGGLEFLAMMLEVELSRGRKVGRYGKKPEKRPLKGTGSGNIAVRLVILKTKNESIATEIFFIGHDSVKELSCPWLWTGGTKEVRTRKR